MNEKPNCKLNGHGYSLSPDGICIYCGAKRGDDINAREKEITRRDLSYIFDPTDRYRFKGMDGSLGYRTGKIYQLQIIPAFFKGGLVIQRKGWARIFNGPGYCPYDNIRLFFDNWEIQ